MQTSIQALIANAALLVALSVIYELTYLLIASPRIKQAVNGILAAIACLAVMSVSFELIPGIVFDTRSILISVTALIFGPVSTVITVVPAIVYRLLQGGIGAPAGVLTILLSAGVGLIWRCWLFPLVKKLRWLNVLLMSLCVHALIIGGMFILLPYPENLLMAREIAWPIITIYPVVSTLLCLLLLKQQSFRQMQEALRQSEEQFRLLFDKAPLSYQSTDLDGRITDVNEQWLATFGYGREEVVGRPFSDFLDPAYQETYRYSFQTLTELGQVRDEFYLRHKKGSRIYVAFDGKIGFNWDNGLKQIYCILSDVTQQRKAKAMLRDSEQKYRRLFETMAQGVVYQDRNGNIISANPAAERILGFSLDQLLDKNSQDPDWRTIREDGTEMPGSEHPAMVALRTGEPVGPVVLGVFQPKLNDHAWLSVNAIPILGPDGQPQVYTTFQDITAVKKARQDYHLLFNAMVDGFALHEMICDADGNPVDYRFLAVNPAFEQITGLKAANLVGKTIMEAIPDTESYWIETYGKVALTGETIRFENFAAFSGKYFRVVAYQPAPGQFACTFSDDTMRVLAQKELHRTLARLRGLLSNGKSPIIIFDETGRIMDMSLITEKIVGFSRREICGKSMYELGLSHIMEKALSCGSDEGHVIESIDVYELQGQKRYFESRLFLIDGRDEPLRLFGYLGIDVTARIMAEQALKESEAKYSSYIENAPYAVVVFDENGHFLESNKAASLITGYSREALLQMNVMEMTAGQSLDAARRHFSALTETGKMSAELQYRHQDGSVRWWTLDAVKLSDGRFLGFSIDITDRKQAEAELINLNQRDYLTGVYNRRFFESELARMDAQEWLPLSVMIGDINGVKLINDAFGHLAGDRLIAESSGILESCCREGDVLARIGGDEFAILMPRTDSETAFRMLKKIQERLREFDASNPNDKYQHSVSLGCATKTSMAEDIKEIIKAAEDYMYRRKLLEHNSLHSTIVSSIRATMFEKSHETEAHAQRLAALSKAVGKALNLSQAEMDKLELLATLHDIGKVGVRDEILTKPCELNDMEWVEMKRHPEIGFRIAKTSPELSPVAEGILSHQEWWNGRGYPQGISGDSIPLISRIVAVIDAYDAMTNDRPYRKALTHEEAVRRIRQNAGTQFDPDIAEIFIHIVSRWHEQEGNKAPA